MGQTETHFCVKQITEINEVLTDEKHIAKQRSNSE